MTKHIRIENADTSPYRVKVLIQDLVEGTWVTTRMLDLNYPTEMVREAVYTTRRIVIEENGSSND